MKRRFQGSVKPTANDSVSRSFGYSVISLRYPFDEKTVRSLKAGEAVTISGRIYTGRDKFHKWVADGGAMPVDFRDGALYHCGPVCVEAGDAWRVASAGPTTSVRENPYEPEFIAKSGVRIIIGKGGMDAATLAAMKKHGCVYVQAVGGAGALYAASVKRVAGVSLLKEFGAAEAVWHFDVEGFRGVVAMDAHGRSLFAETEASSKEALDSMVGRTAGGRAASRPKRLSQAVGRPLPHSPSPAGEIGKAISRSLARK